MPGHLALKDILALRIYRCWLDQNGATLLLATLEDQMETACSEYKTAGTPVQGRRPMPGTGETRSPHWRTHSQTTRCERESLSVNVLSG